MPENHGNAQGNSRVSRSTRSGRYYTLFCEIKSQERVMQFRANAFLKLGEVSHILVTALASCCCQPGMYFETSISRSALASSSDGRLQTRIS